MVYVEALEKAIIRPSDLKSTPVDPSEDDEVLIGANEVYEVKAIPNKGQGMFATAKIQPGQLILREKPLIVMPNSIFR